MAVMNADADLKSVLQQYLQMNREALLWKLEGLAERDLRMPRTPTGMNLVGIVKHMTNVEIGYFGDTFGRAWPTEHERIALDVFDTDPQADWYATEDESAAGILDLYRRVWAFADETIASRELNAVGSVPWWPEDRNAVTLGHIMVRVLGDLARHTGQADIVRENFDGSVGMRADNTNIPDEDWSAYTNKLREIAEKF